jgi:hypothetical protein
LSVSEFQIYRYERGTRQPNLNDAVKLGLLYDVPVEKLFPDLIRRARRQLDAAFKKTAQSPPRMMTLGMPSAQRILALDPWSRGIGAAVLYGETLVLCRVRHLRGPPLPDRLLRHGIAAVKEFIKIYQPGVLLLPNLHQSHNHRSPHALAFCQLIARVAARQRIKVVERNREQIEEVLGVQRGTTRHQLAVIAANKFPILRAKLPPPRKPWQPQDLRLSAFYAVALALTANQKRSASNLNQAAERRGY